MVSWGHCNIHLRDICMAMVTHFVVLCCNLHKISMWLLKRRGPRMEPRGTPHVIFAVNRIKLCHVFKLVLSGHSTQPKLTMAVLTACLIF